MKVILESSNFPLSNKIKKIILGIHRTLYGHLKVWSKIEKFDPSGIGSLLKIDINNSKIRFLIKI
jgi:hypothetical protein